jgi:hypothetical protein
MIEHELRGELDLTVANQPDLVSKCSEAEMNLIELTMNTFIRVSTQLPGQENQLAGCTGKVGTQQA